MSTINGFPVIHKDTNCIVYANKSDEIFIRNTSGVEVRITPNTKSIIMTAAGSVIEPTSVNGLSAVKVSKMK